MPACGSPFTMARRSFSLERGSPDADVSEEAVPDPFRGPGRDKLRRQSARPAAQPRGGISERTSGENICEEGQLRVRDGPAANSVLAPIDDRARADLPRRARVLAAP